MVRDLCRCFGVSPTTGYKWPSSDSALRCTQHKPTASIYAIAGLRLRKSTCAIKLLSLSIMFPNICQ